MVCHALEIQVSLFTTSRNIHCMINTFVYSVLDETVDQVIDYPTPLLIDEGELSRNFHK